jgi:transcriptional regulator with XRE-family HTH domain
MLWDMKKLGDAIRHLMETKEVTGVQLSMDIGLTATSISRILNGASRPRQVTLSRLMKRLCETREEEQSILRAYASTLEGLPEELIIDDEENRREEIARCERFLEIKTQSVSFKSSVARELVKAGIEARQDYCEGLVSTDFLIERDGKRIALECKFNVHRDFEKTRIIAGIIHDRLHCDLVFIVVPFLQDSDMDLFKKVDGISLIADQDLVKTLQSLTVDTQ